jgi:large subunit ribosomal protein L7/L12
MTEEKKEIPTKFKELLEKIETMTVLELAEFVKILEEKFGVSAQAPIAIATAPSAGSESAKPKEEQTTFNIEITDAGPNKISVIKVVREITNLGLKEAKDLVDAAPKIVKEGVGKEEAEEIKKKLEAAGAKVTLK